VDGVVDKQKIETLIRERKLTSEGLDPRTVTEIREKMERPGPAACSRTTSAPSSRRRLRGLAVKSGGGKPDVMRSRGCLAASETGIVSPVALYPLLSVMNAFVSTRNTVTATSRKRRSSRGSRTARLTIAVTLEEAGDVLKRGAILVDEADEYGLEPHVLVTLDHAIRDGRPAGMGNRV